ncbi:helix-turn-helix domain-containing protein [Actinomadura fibrosa]|uniref:Helix-turn-helix domain-containing protein n=1 Tax=Actinomadura fibrosa TaxID=111802 RepID=A0ABW2XMZ2_9ACTN|nr:helix-turn-helix domain-containing protein [Actinomadura fibrosa]
MNVIGTAGMPAAERLAFRREVSAKLWGPCDRRRGSHAEVGFRADSGVSEFGPVQAALVTTAPHAVRCTPDPVRRPEPEVFKLGCVVRGGGLVEQDDRRADLQAGDLILVDTSRPFLGRCAPDAPASLLLLRFPREALPLPARDVRRLNGVRIPGSHGVGALSSQFLLQLAARMDELGPSETARLSALVLDVLTVALAGALDVHGAAPSSTRQGALMAQIRAFMEKNLGDARLTPEAIAVANHISLRYLHKLFQQDGHTVAGWIRERRLEACRRDLTDPRLASRSIGAIAAGWGFSSPAHFSQAFRATYGLSPRQYRTRTPTL